MSRKGSDSTVCQTLLDDGDLESDWTDRLAVVRLKQNNQTSDVVTLSFKLFRLLNSRVMLRIIFQSLCYKLCLIVIIYFPLKIY